MLKESYLQKISAARKPNCCGFYLMTKMRMMSLSNGTIEKCMCAYLLVATAKGMKVAPTGNRLRGHTRWLSFAREQLRSAHENGWSLLEDQMVVMICRLFWIELGPGFP